MKFQRWLRSGQKKPIDAVVTNDETKVKWCSKLKKIA